MSIYKGARFYKCDLHMHTPMDRNWRDGSTRLKYEDPDERKREVARLYLQRCHQVGLEVIAITDHNFAVSPEHSFLRWLRAENESVARELEKTPLFIFGGFEVEADVGTGHHVLCLLPIDMELHIMDGRALSCGLKHEERFDDQGRPKQSTKRLTDIIEVIQKEKTNTGIVICAHPFNKNGLLCDDNAQMWLQQEEFRNSDLLCIEVPKQIEAMPQGIKKLIIGGEDCFPEWKRKRPIACVMSSDCYRLESDPQESSNYIGYRFTWIKMSKPSIESLRQAFLDRESRIRFGEKSPEDKYDFPRITKVAVNGATFYQAQPFNFSCNLNCIIGSRGTGKSTLVDYIRISLDRLRAEDIPERLRKDILERINETLPTNSQVTVEILRDGVNYRIEYLKNEQPQYRVINLNTNESDPNWDVRSLFDIKILSQREVDQSIESQDPTPLRRILDDFIRQELSMKNEEANRIISNIKQIQIELATLKEKQLNRPALETDKAGLEATLQLLESLQEPLRVWQGVSAERSFFLRLFSQCDEIMQYLSSELEKIDLESANIEELQNTPNPIIIQKAHNIANAAFKLLIGGIKNSIEGFERRTIDENAPLKKLYEEWLPLYEREIIAFESIKLELEAKGDKPEQFLYYKKELNDIKETLNSLDEELQKINTLEVDKKELLKNLRKCWREETEIREQKAQDLMEHLRLDASDRFLIQIKVAHQGDLNYLYRNMIGFLKDRRRLNEEDIGNVVMAIARNQTVDNQATVIESIINECKLGNESDILRRTLPGRLEVFLSCFNETAIQQLELIRIPDKVEYFVYRQDGSLAGPIEKVSVGQKGLAFLNLLLASGNEPLIIDTPEEGLDNEGVYTQLVPIFRREKEKRQIIVVTHNANIPVNADAELIVALEATGYVSEEVLKKWTLQLEKQLNEDQIKHIQMLIRNQNWEDSLVDYLRSSQNWEEEIINRLITFIGRERQAKGHIKTWKEAPNKPIEQCIGALDCMAVKNSVQDIMEGTEEAFTRRREKYGF